jgi:hypothetical protein
MKAASIACMLERPLPAFPHRAIAGRANVGQVAPVEARITVTDRVYSATAMPVKLIEPDRLERVLALAHFCSSFCSLFSSTQAHISSMRFSISRTFSKASHELIMQTNTMI